ncbi:nickel-responsive transcriptional regulator NikR [Candidatus Bathyarchaeota archaeon]|nr:MAG: nickel-responsive transcriptional regulator NikR [Candidatus Bathyarchaeota archaeon]
MISLALPEKLLEELDQLSNLCGYTSRSEVIRDSIRNFISKYRWTSMPEGNFIATLMFIYEKERVNINLLTKLEHKFDDIIITNIHMHIEQKNCLEILILKGSGERIKELTSKISSIRNIGHVEFASISTG